MGKRRAGLKRQAPRLTVRTIAVLAGSSLWQGIPATPGGWPLSQPLLAIVFLLGLALGAPQFVEPDAARAQVSAPERKQTQEPAESEELPEAEPRAAVSAICPNRFTVSASGIPMTVAYCTDPGRSLDARDEAVRRAVVMVHGSGRNADEYHAYARASAVAVGAASSTIVVAPQYLEQEDVDAFKTPTQPLGDLLYWNGRWREGGDSLDTATNRRAATISSFAATDQIIGRLADRAYFPNLGTIVIAGHSAGGQFTNRFAAASVAEPAGISLRYVAMNPSSWLYFTGERRVGTSLDQFSVPSVAEQQRCPGFNGYKYGVESLASYPYVAAVGPEGLKALYAARTVAYLLGERDNADTNSLDTDCEARLQGDYRLDRGNRYYNHVGQVFGASVYSRHVKEIVPGVAHSGNGMINSGAGRKLLFDHSPTSPVTLTPTATAAPTFTPTPTPTPAVSCSPRPRVDVAAAPASGVLSVTIAATGAGNSIRGVRLGVDGRPLSNAIVDVAGGPNGMRDGAHYTPSAPTHRLQLTIRRATPGQPTVVPIVVTDACGPWETFVGGGTGAGF